MSQSTVVPHTPAGVYAVTADMELVLVHAYGAPGYDLGDVAELLQLGRMAAGPEPIGRVLELERNALRELRVAVDAYSFDLEPGFVEMCSDIAAYAGNCRDPVLRLTSRADERAP